MASPMKIQRDAKQHDGDRRAPVYLPRSRMGISAAPLMPNQDQIIDATMARSIQTDAARTHPLLAWVVTRNEAAHPGQFAARLVTDAVTPCVVLADTLGELHAQLPPGLDRSDRQPS